MWLTISMGVMVSTLGVVYGTLFGQKLSEYLPLVATGLVIWNLFSVTVNEGGRAYITSANYIRQVRTPKLVFILQTGWRNAAIFAHNFVIIVIVLAIFGVKSWALLLLFIPGIALLILNALWIAALVSVLSARFRDVPQIVEALLQVALYVTPILFSGQMLAGEHYWIVEFNPLSYVVDAARDPLLGTNPTGMTWGISAGLAVAGWIVALTVTGRYLKRIPYWV